MSILSRHIVASSIVLILCVVFFVESLNYPADVALLPQILIIIISFLAIGMSVEYYHKNKNSKKENEEDKTEVSVKSLIIMGGLTLIYILSIDTIGYFIVTPLFLFISLVYLKAAKIITAVLVSVILPLFIYLIFSVFLNIPIPMGVFI